MSEAAPEPTRDEDLMRACQEGSQAAFEELYARYKGPVYRLAFRYLGDAQAAEDAALEVFVNVYRKAATYRYPLRFSTWLYKITRNHAINRLKRQAAQRALSLEAGEPGEEGGRLIDQLAGDGLPPGDALAQAEAESLVRQALADLPDVYREVLVLKVYEGLSCKEIGEVVGCPEGTVWSRIHHGLERLKGKLSRMLRD